VVYGSVAARFAGVRGVYSLISGLGSAFLGTHWKHQLLSRVACAFYRAALAGNERVFFQNSDDLGMFLRRRIIRSPQQAVLLGGAGVDLRRFQPVSIPKGGPCFLFVGRLLRDKGVYEYVQAARTLSIKYPGPRFVLIGAADSNPSSASLAEVRAWVEAGFLEWHSCVDDVRPWLAEASVFVLPSYREGSPRAALEAMAMGRPIVTTATPGCRDTVEEGGNGFLVPVGDPHAVAAAMERFVLDPRLLERMGRRSREIACARFDICAVNSAILRTLGLKAGAGARPHPGSAPGPCAVRNAGRVSGFRVNGED
jgi:glycosyltransferase involved in cell wall biosynthesis